VISIVLFCLTFGLLNIHSDKPFWGIHDWNGARNSNIARNYLRYGLVETKLGQIENSGFTNHQNYVYYTHFPPVLTLLMAGSFRVFGVTEWAARLIPILSTCGVMVLIFLIGELIINWELGLVAALLSLATPLVLYFGKNPVQEPLVVFFVLLSYFGFLNLSAGKKYQSIFIGGMILAELTTWAGFFLIPALTIICLLRKDTQGVKKLVPFWILSVVLFVLYLFYVRLITGNFFGGGLYAALLQRSGIGEAGKVDNINMPAYLLRLRLWYSTLFTSTLSWLSILWLISKVVTKKVVDSDWQILTLGIFGVTYSLIFINASYIHNYLVFYQLPFISLSAAIFIKDMVEKFSLSQYRRLLAGGLILMVFLERFEFIKALDQSSSDRFPVEVGRFINHQTKPDETVIVQSDPIFRYTAENFLKFYGDRKLVFSQEASGFGVVVNIDNKRQIYRLISN